MAALAGITAPRQPLAASCSFSTGDNALGIVGGRRDPVYALHRLRAGFGLCCRIGVYKRLHLSDMLAGQWLTNNATAVAPAKAACCRPRLPGHLRTYCVRNHNG